MKKLLTLLIILTSYTIQGYSQNYNDLYGWLKQEMPHKILTCKPGRDLPESMLLESLSGLAAQAVNKGKFDEMVWINAANSPSYENLYTSIIQEFGAPTKEFETVWELLEYLMKYKIVKGYILYKADLPRNDPYAYYPDINYSCNVATVYSGLLKGLLVEESIEEKIQKYGLKCLKDARHETPELCFQLNKHKLNNQSAASNPPSVSNLRDYVITHRLMIYADDKELANEVLEWVQPLSPILGWGCGDEYDYTSLISLWGHVNTASNWCWNLPLISTMRNFIKPAKLKEKPINEIDFNNSDIHHAFVMSDGDNMQWTIGNFIENPAYWGNSQKSAIGLSWTLCPIELSIVSPMTWNSLVKSKPSQCSLIEYGGGYQYPDLFAKNRNNRKELLRKFAQRVNMHLSQLGIKVFGFICRDISSPEAQEAFQIYAEELDGISGMIAVQYFPYEQQGEIYWKENKKGINIPIVTARYSIWNEINASRPRAGTPEYIASLINRDIAGSNKDNLRNTWTIVHAWSDFSESSNIVKRPSIGVNPVYSACKLISHKIKTVSIHELLWHIRMEHYPEQTQKALMEE